MAGKKFPSASTFSSSASRSAASSPGIDNLIIYLSIYTDNLCQSSSGAAGLADFAAEVGGEDFNGAAHFVEAGAHAGANAVG